VRDITFITIKCIPICSNTLACGFLARQQSPVYRTRTTWHSMLATEAINNRLQTRSIRRKIDDSGGFF
jgi:hypothetical protein